MKRWAWTLIALILCGCIGASASQPVQPNDTGIQSDQVNDTAIARQISVALENYGPAPELQNEVWLNTDRPLRLTDLRGQVVLLEMWTFG